MLLSPATLLAVTLLGSPTTEEDRLSAARIAFAAEDFATAVRGFEALAHDFPATAKYHYYAGLARENAGQDTHAFVHMQLFLKSNAGTPEERSIAEKRVAAISRRTTRTRIQLPANDLPAVLHITYQGPKPQATRPPISAPLSVFPVVDVRPELLLEPGTWELKVTPALLGDQMIEPMVITIAAGTPVEAIRLKTTAAPQVPVIIDLKQPTAIRRKITVELRREGSTAAPIILTTSEPTLHTTLPPGTWTYKATGRNLKRVEGILSISRATRQVLQFASTIDDTERTRRRHLGFGLMGSGLVTAAIGGPLVGVAVVQQNRTLMPVPPGTQGENADQFLLANTGVALLGGTTGLWISAASSSIRRPRGWIPELTLGFLTTAVGVTWFGFAQRELPDSYDPKHPDPTLALKSHPEALVSAFVMGIGAGLLTGAVFGFLSTRKAESSSRASLNISPGPRSTAISFKLAF